jgi:hypothetical protein
VITQRYPDISSSLRPYDGPGYDPRLSEGALKPPILLTSTYVFETAAAGKCFFQGVVSRQVRSKGMNSSRLPSIICHLFATKITTCLDAPC